MDLPRAIDQDKDSVYGATVPDMPGCYVCSYAWGDTIADAIKNAREAGDCHVDASVLDGAALTGLRGSKIENLMENAAFAGAIRALVDIEFDRDRCSCWLRKT